MTFTETILVGRTSSVALAALGPANAILLVVTEMCAASSITACMTTASETDPERVKEYMNAAVCFSALVGGALTAALALGVHPLLALFGVDGALCDAARAYVTVRAIGVPFYLLSNFAEGCFIGFQEDSFKPLVIYLKGTAVTFVLLLAMLSRSGGAAAAALTASLNGFVVVVAAATAVGYVMTGALFLKELMRADLADLRWAGFGPLRSLAVTNGYQLAGGLMRQVTYAVMSITAATMGVVPCAAHKIAYEVGGWGNCRFLVPLTRDCIPYTSFNPSQLGG